MVVVVVVVVVEVVEEEALKIAFSHPPKLTALSRLRLMRLL